MRMSTKKRRMCPHRIQAYMCLPCSGPGRGAFCEHSVRKWECAACGGASICQHGRYRPKCAACGGPAYCQHRERRTRCPERECVEATAAFRARRAEVRGQPPRTSAACMLCAAPAGLSDMCAACTATADATWAEIFRGDDESGAGST